MINKMIAEFERTDEDLKREIEREQSRSGVHDPGNFAYPPFAKAATQRRENLKRSIDELRSNLNDAKMALAEAVDQLVKVETLDERRQIAEANVMHE